MKRILVAVVLMFGCSVLAHSGGLDKYGCHTNHKTGDYHCHGNGKVKVTKATKAERPR